MQLIVQPGKYVVAVSGGVDSVVLLDMLAKYEGIELVVAHFDHGIREDSASDGEFVRGLADKYDLPYETERIELGEGASEAVAREARYNFLRRVQEKHQAVAVVTAHHQDDLLETTIINLLRGTGRRGMHSVSNSGNLIRPMLHLTKSEVIKYATENNLQWHEDSTNADTNYLRNKIRHHVLPTANEQWRVEMMSRIAQASEINSRLDKEIDTLLNYRMLKGRMTISRTWFVKLPHAIAAELITALLRKLSVTDIDHKMVERLVIGIKAGKMGAKLDIDKSYYLLITKRSARVMNRITSKTAHI